MITLSIFFESCLSMQPDTTMLSPLTERFSISTENKDLKTIFSENKELLIQYKIEPDPTSQNVNKFLHHIIWDGNYTLVKEIIGAMSDLGLIKQYTQLYQAIRDEEKGIETLRKLLEEGVNPNGCNVHDRPSLTPIKIAQRQYEFYKKLNPKNIVFKNEYEQQLGMTKEQWEQHTNAYFSRLKEEYENIYQLLKKYIFEEDSPLMVARKLKNYAAMQLLLDHGAYDSLNSARQQLEKIETQKQRLSKE